MSTCAIIGNSPIVLSSKNGNLIDKHDHVIRFNLAKTEGFETHVGSKTTHRYCNLHPILCLLSKSHLDEHTKYFPEWDNNFIMTWKNLQLNVKDLEIEKEPGGDLVKKKFLQNGVNVFCINREFVSFCRNSLLKSEPTMGFIAILEAVSKNYKQINCFGFDFYENEGRAHYFENTVPYKSCHSSQTEQQLINELVVHEKGRINLHI